MPFSHSVPSAMGNQCTLYALKQNQNACVWNSSSLEKDIHAPCEQVTGNTYITFFYIHTLILLNTCITNSNYISYLNIQQLIHVFN